MPRPQFTIRRLLVATATIGCCLVALCYIPLQSIAAAAACVLLTVLLSATVWCVERLFRKHGSAGRLQFTILRLLILVAIIAACLSLLRQYPAGIIALVAFAVVLLLVRWSVIVVIRPPRVPF